MGYVSILKADGYQFAPPANLGFVKSLSWLPLGFTEFHLSAYYFVLAVRLQGGRPELCVILDPRYLARPLLDNKGEWAGGYKPVALRTFPFRLEGKGTTIEEVEVPIPSPWLVEEGGTPLMTEDSPSAFVGKIYEMLLGLRQSRARLEPVLDRLFMADLMVPLKAPNPLSTSETFFVADRARFSRLSNQAFRALASQDFHAIEIAMASIFSQRLLHRSCLTTQPRQETPAHEAGIPREYTSFFAGLDGLPPILDEDELFSLDDVGELHLKLE
ncbi:SapC family protein [Terrihabitans sp. B22-R8]|uniref:SapC family protein n=1 Tax=Terrihabitans sp. B22-R8 TaxID=3425128 RepID=UPI00403C8F3B